MRTILRPLLAALVAAALIFTAAPAQAHDELVSADPPANATLTEAPTELTLTYSANLMDIESGNRVRVTDSAGNLLVEGAGDAKVKGTTVTQTINVKDPKADETYTVTWRVVSSDGHPIQGTYTFTVGAGKSGAASVNTQQNPGTQAATGDQGIDNGANLWLWSGAGVALAALITLVAVFARGRKKQ